MRQGEKGQVLFSTGECEHSWRGQGVGVPQITSAEQTLQEFCLRATVAFGVNTQTAVLCSEELKRTQLGLRVMVLHQTDQKSLQLTLKYAFLIENKPQHLTCLQNTVQMCENNTNEGQMQMKVRPCHTSVADGSVCQGRKKRCR